MMKTHVKPSRDLRNNYAEVVRLLDEHDQVIITNRGKGEAVLIGMNDYADYEEYLHRRYVLASLHEAEKQASDPKTKWLSHEQVWDAIESDA
jgi:prevent-host-death family protein